MANDKEDKIIKELDEISSNINGLKSLVKFINDNDITLEMFLVNPNKNKYSLSRYIVKTDITSNNSCNSFIKGMKEKLIGIINDDIKYYYKNNLKNSYIDKKKELQQVLFDNNTAINTNIIKSEI